MNELFKIFNLNADAVKEIETAPNNPHRHDYEELIIGISGQLEHFIDFNSKTIPAPLVSFVTQGKVHRVKPQIRNGKCNMWVLRFKSEFIPETIFQLYSFYHDSANLTFRNNNGFRRLVRLCKMIFDEMQQPAPDLAVVRQLLSTLFVMIESERKKLELPEAGIRKTQSVTFKNFLRILEENFRRPEGVEFYAEKLFMTSRNLNLICQNILQQSVSEIIETRKLIEAKNLLVTTDKTISEIGFELGYNEKSYFTNVFRKKAGLTPSDFRNDMRKLVS